jgi:hypothetical protein
MYSLEGPNEYRHTSTHLTSIVDMCGIKLVTTHSNGRVFGELESGDLDIKDTMDRPNMGRIASMDLVRVWLDRLCG